VVILVAWLVHRYVERPLAPRLRSALRRLGTRTREPVRRG
jgi:peptidoglycan/LPS O-acetylase OafA/YrhL